MTTTSIDTNGSAPVQAPIAPSNEGDTVAQVLLAAAQSSQSWGLAAQQSQQSAQNWGLAAQQHALGMNAIISHYTGSPAPFQSLPPPAQLANPQALFQSPAFQANTSTTAQSADTTPSDTNAGTEADPNAGTPFNVSGTPYYYYCSSAPIYQIHQKRTHQCN